LLCDSPPSQTPLLLFVTSLSGPSKGRSIKRCSGAFFSPLFFPCLPLSSPQGRVEQSTSIGMPRCLDSLLFSGLPPFCRPGGFFSHFSSFFSLGTLQMRRRWGFFFRLFSSFSGFAASVDKVRNLRPPPGPFFFFPFSPSPFYNFTAVVVKEKQPWPIRSLFFFFCVPLWVVNPAKEEVVGLGTFFFFFFVLLPPLLLPGWSEVDFGSLFPLFFPFQSFPLFGA